MTFEEMRADFIRRRRGSVALPITGVIVYSAAALLSLVTPGEWHNLVLTLCFWSIMPIGALVMRLRGEQDGNPAIPCSGFPPMRGSWRWRPGQCTSPFGSTRPSCSR